MTIIRPLCNSHFWAWSKFNSFANFDPLMANNGSLKLLDQAEYVVGLLAGGRDNCKNKVLVQGKQTVHSTYMTWFLWKQCQWTRSIVSISLVFLRVKFGSLRFLKSVWSSKGWSLISRLPSIICNHTYKYVSIVYHNGFFLATWKRSIS